MTYDNQYQNFGQHGASYPNQYYPPHSIAGAFPPADLAMSQSSYLQPGPAHVHYPIPAVEAPPGHRFEEEPPRQPINQSLAANPTPQATVLTVPPANATAVRVNIEASAKRPPQADELPLDYLLLLLSLADEYLAAAHSQGMLVALAKRPASADQYYKLIATGLGCIESVLQNWRLPPAKEAEIRLRYVQILFDETENDLNAETALSKGIELCERNKLFGLKYSMQALLACVLQRSNPKAALKAMDRMIEDVEAYRHTAYEYAFRFLRATSSLSPGFPPDLHSSIHQLQRISAIARQQGDYVVAAFAAATESLVQLQSRNVDSIDSAQRAIASARQLQLKPGIASSPQLQILTEFVDLCCSLHETKLDQTSHKLLNMQQTMDRTVDDPHWQDDGTFYVPLSKRSVNGVSLSNTGVVSERNDKPRLAMKWLAKGDVYAVGYLLSTVSVAYKNASDGHKAEKFLDEGLRLVRTNLAATETVSGSLVASLERVTWRRILECQYLLQRAFLLCDRSNWESARATLDEADLIGHHLGNRMPPELNCIARYLNGTIYQGTGDLAAALSIFQSATFALPSTPNRTSHNDIRCETSLLAGLNTILIIHPPSHPSHHLLQPLLARITPFLQKNTTSNPLLQSAHSLIVSILTGLSSHDGTSASVAETSTPILRTKQHLGAALATARQIGNAQIISLSLALMTDKFFRGVVGDQAEKSARASSAMARKSGNVLWTSVCDGMLAESLTVQGKRGEADKAREDALRVAEMLPAGLQKRPEA